MERWSLRTLGLTLVRPAMQRSYSPRSAAKTLAGKVLTSTLSQRSMSVTAAAPQRAEQAVGGPPGSQPAVPGGQHSAPRLRTVPYSTLMSLQSAATPGGAAASWA